jgi:hypothetical protein
MDADDKEKKGKSRLWGRVRNGLLWLLLLVSGTNTALNVSEIGKLNTLLQDRGGAIQQYERNELQQLHERNSEAKETLENEIPRPQSAAYLERNVLRDAQRATEIGRQQLRKKEDEVLKKRIELLERLVWGWKDREIRGEKQGVERLLEIVSAAQDVVEAVQKMVVSNTQPHDDRDNRNREEVT